MNEEEKILLDAEVLRVIEPGVYRAVLANGHGFTAFVPGHHSAACGGEVGPGARVRVQMSPFDFSRGAIVDFE
jgi:translation initiation factor IF-1